MEEVTSAEAPRYDRLAFVVVMLLAVYFRFAHLGESALRADTINFWNICRQDLTAGQIMSRWMELMGNSGHFPFPNAVIKWVLDVFGLPLTHFTLRLPSAIWGVLTVGAAFGLGKSLGGRKMGLVLAALMAVNPYHIQTSREAYFYAPLLLGCCVLAWVACWVVNYYRGEEKIGGGFFVLTVTGTFFAAYSQPNGWSIVGLTALVILATLVLKFLRDKRVDYALLGALAIVVVLLIPALAAPWGIKQLSQSVSAEHLQTYTRDTKISRSPLWSVLYTVVTSFGWGSTPVRALFTALLLLLGLFGLVAGRRERPTFLLMPYFMAGVIALTILGQVKANLVYSPRFFVAMLPMYLAVLSLGIFAVVRLPWLKKHSSSPKGSMVVLALAGVAVLLNIYPAHLCVRLKGKPTPYRKIVSTVEKLLPRGTPVLVDRWFEPWNELKLYNAKNVFFTFTVPNEPLDNYQKHNWPQTVTNFFARFPGAAYLEISKPYWDAEEVGPWDWPRKHLMQRETIVNEAGLKLRKLGLASRAGFYKTYTNRVVVELFYDTEADLIEKGRRAGQSVVTTYGPTWGYTKTRDYRDWRVLQDAAAIHLHNISATNQRVTVVLSGMAPNGSKKVDVNRHISYTFENGKSDKLHLGPLDIPPGRATITLEDTLWSTARIPLLVDRIDVRVLPPLKGS